MVNLWLLFPDLLLIGSVIETALDQIHKLLLTALTLLLRCCRRRQHQIQGNGISLLLYRIGDGLVVDLQHLFRVERGMSAPIILNLRSCLGVLCVKPLASLRYNVLRADDTTARSL